MRRLYLTLFLVILAVGFAVFVFWHYFYLGTLVLDVVPTSAEVTINGKPVVDRTLHLNQGTYTVTVGAPGYRHEQFEFSSKVGSHTVKRIELAILPQPTKILDGPISDLTATPDRNLFFFKRGDALYRYDRSGPAGTPAMPITPTIPSIQAVDWAPDFALALLRKPAGEIGIYDFNKYDFLNQKYTPLGTSYLKAVWAVDGSGIYGQYKEDNGETSLVKINRAGQDLIRLGALTGFPMSSLELTTGPENKLLISGTDTKQPTDLYLFDTNQRIITPVTDTTRAHAPVLSPDKNHLAYLDSGELVSANIDGTSKRNLNIRAAAGNYQFATNKTLVVFTENKITTVDTTTGQNQSFEVYAPSATISSLVAAPDEKTIFYNYKGSVYQLIFNPNK